MQTLSSGPQGGEQGWAGMGHPKLLPVAMPPPNMFLLFHYCDRVPFHYCYRVLMGSN